MPRSKISTGRRAGNAAKSEGAKQKDENALVDREIGQRIRHLRVEILGIDRQADFAEQLGVSRGAVGNWELGKGIKRANLLRIAQKFRISHDWLATNTGSPVARPSLESRMELLPPSEYEKMYEWVDAMIDRALKNAADAAAKKKR
jgi:transcriptional regulator with XRE-family HTH domain